MPVFSIVRLTAHHESMRSTPVTVTRIRTPIFVPVSVIVSPMPASAGFGGWWYSASTSPSA